MTAPKGRDPDVQAAIDRSVTWWTRRLQPLLLPGLDAALIARDGVEHMHSDGWRRIERSPRIPEPGRRDPDTAHRGAAYARQLLTQPDQGGA